MMAEAEGSTIEVHQRKKPKSSENKESVKEEKSKDTPIPERAPNITRSQKRILLEYFGYLLAQC